MPLSFSSRNPEKLSALVAAVGSNAIAGTIAEATSFTDKFWIISQSQT
ncbi:hypothetical protein JOY44_03425 [Phormidium sp. CLA17]|nr:hypothetical protein [Leptolyngbya sp. Cla-17]